MDACMCIVHFVHCAEQNGNGRSFPFRTKPELAIQYSNHYKTTKVCSHLISNSQQNCKCQLGFQVFHSQEDQGGPSRSSGGSVTPSRRPHRLPDNLNRELEIRKLGPGQTQLSFSTKIDCSQMILYRRQNKSGKSSAESEGSPDEVFILEFLDICMFRFLFPTCTKQ